jgi:ketosteroid isomerase-like protein
MAQDVQASSLNAPNYYNGNAAPHAGRIGGASSRTLRWRIACAPRLAALRPEMHRLKENACAAHGCRRGETEMTDTQHRAPVHDPQDLARSLVARQRAGDAEGMALLYEPGAVLHLPDGRLAAGREAIRAFYAGLIAAGRTFELGEQRPATLPGDLALTSTRLPTGSVTAEVARRQSDGTWLWAIDRPSIA